MPTPNKSICIFLPGKLYRPIGGHKIVYQHANYLAGQGYKIIIANCIFQPSNKGFVFETLRRIHAIMRFISRALRRKNSCKNWFNLHDSIQIKHVWTYRPKWIPKASFYVATDATTSHYLLELDTKIKNKFYFIQGYENWNMTDKELIQTYHFPCTILVISNWLKAIMDRDGVPCKVIPNGYDPNDFYIETTPENRDGKHISMLFHHDAVKNSELGFKALALVHEQIPDIRVSLFGVYNAPADLPDYYTYYKSPDKATHNRINNTASIYLGTSTIEGWGLTVLEAMACGQAVVCTDNAGYLEMAQNEINALVSPINDAEALANHILELINNDEKRIVLANNGIKTASGLTIDNSNRLFASCFIEESEIGTTDNIQI